MIAFKKDIHDQTKPNILFLFANDQHADALECSCNSSDLHCGIREGFYSSALLQLAYIPYRPGRELKFMDDYEKFANDSEADTLFTRRYCKPYVVPDEI